MTAIRPQGRAGVLALLPASLFGGRERLLRYRIARQPLCSTGSRQKTNGIHFGPPTGRVTVKLLVQDPNGYFIPGIRRRNFAVCVDGVRQNDAAAEIEHAPVTLPLLFEYGGRYRGLNKSLIEEMSRAARQLAEAPGRQDRRAFRVIAMQSIN